MKTVHFNITQCGCSIQEVETRCYSRNWRREHSKFYYYFPTNISTFRCFIIFITLYVHANITKKMWEFEKYLRTAYYVYVCVVLWRICSFVWVWIQRLLSLNISFTWHILYGMMQCMCVSNMFDGGISSASWKVAISLWQNEYKASESWIRHHMNIQRYANSVLAFGKARGSFTLRKQSWQSIAGSYSYRAQSTCPRMNLTYP